MLDKNAIQDIYNKRERTPAEDFIFNTLEDIEYIKNRFVVIGYRLVEAVRNDYVFDLGYSDITELAEDVFGIKKSMAYALMNISRYFCVGMELRDNYKCFSQSQLIEITQCPAYLQSSITSDMTVQDIRDYRKILSGYKTFLRSLVKNFVNATKLQRFLARHKVVAVGVTRDFLYALARIFGQNAI